MYLCPQESIINYYSWDYNELVSLLFLFILLTLSPRKLWIPANHSSEILKMKNVFYKRRHFKRIVQYGSKQGTYLNICVSLSSERSCCLCQQPGLYLHSEYIPPSYWILNRLCTVYRLNCGKLVTRSIFYFTMQSLTSLSICSSFQVVSMPVLQKCPLVIYFSSTSRLGYGYIFGWPLSRSSSQFSFYQPHNFFPVPVCYPKIHVHTVLNNLTQMKHGRAINKGYSVCQSI